jgi:hypothetical protein
MLVNLGRETCQFLENVLWLRHATVSVYDDTPYARSAENTPVLSLMMYKQQRSGKSELAHSMTPTHTQCKSGRLEDVWLGGAGEF